MAELVLKHWELDLFLSCLFWKLRKANKTVKEHLKKKQLSNIAILHIKR